MARTGSATDVARARAGGCLQCGLPLPRAGSSFCCVGCRLVHELAARGADGEGPAPDRLLSRLSLSAFLAMGVMVFTLSLYGLRGAGQGPEAEAANALRGLLRLGALLFSTPVLVLLGPPLVDAVARTRWRSADGLVVAGVAAAWAVSVWNTFTDRGDVYFETATMVLVLVTLGRWLDVRTRARARDRLRALARTGREPARLLADDGERSVAAEELAPGDRVRLLPGEAVPADGVVEAGRSFVDESRLTGEERPRSVGPGQRVRGGSFLVDGTLDFVVEREGDSTSRAELERLLFESLARRPGLVRAADRVAGLFLPAVLSIAAGTALVHGLRGELEAALLNALSVVLIACPCALGLAVPLSFWAALGAAWRAGVLVRGGDVLERLARARRVFLDKTGTLTTGHLELLRVELLPGARGELDEAGALRLAGALEARSEHPIARALRAHAPGRGGPEVEDFRALPGRGVEGRLEGSRFELVRDEEDPEDEATRALLLHEGRPLARFVLAARLRPEAREVVAELTARGLEPAVLSGDGPGPARSLEQRLGLPVEGGLLPADKVRRLLEAGSRGVVFVGDGLNDSAALAAADVGVAVRGAAPKSLEHASVGLVRDDLRLVPELLASARRAVHTARTNLALAFGYNALGLWLAATGRLSPVFAAAAMVASSLAVCLNATRAGRWPGERLPDSPGTAEARTFSVEGREEPAPSAP